MDDIAVVEMAKKKTKANPKPAPDDANRKPIVLQMRAGPKWEAWVKKLARFENRPLTSLMERALTRYAKEVGFPDEAPER
jgi:hypothetical protein